MKSFLIAASVASLLAATAAFAQTTTPPATNPTSPAVNTPIPTPMATSTNLSLTDEQAKSWIDKDVYTSDEKKVGEVAAFAREASGKVTEMHADVGGFLGIGETRVRLMAAQFKIGTDRVTLSVTSEQVKSLPTIKK